MTDLAPWPPPPTLNDRYRTVPVRHGDRLQMQTLRVALLWGDEVLVDELGRVHCAGCDRLVDAVDLGQPGNLHRPGLPLRADAPPVQPQSYLPAGQLGPLFARIDAALTDGASIAQTMDAIGCTEADVRAVKAIRDRRSTPPPAKPREVWEMW